MPTTGKAAGGILFAALAFVVARMVAPDLPATVPSGPAPLVAAGIGLLTGWRVGGERRGGAGAAAARGVTAALLIAIVTLLVGAGWQMLRRSLRGLYDGPTEAVGEVVRLGVDYGRLLLDPAVLVVLLLGGALAGVVAGAVARRWS